MRTAVLAQECESQGARLAKPPESSLRQRRLRIASVCKTLARFFRRVSMRKTGPKGCPLHSKDISRSCGVNDDRASIRATLAEQP